MDKDQAGSDPGESRVALAGPNLEPTYDEFMANVYPNVHESLKFSADEHIILEDPLNEPRKLNVEAEVVSMVTVLIYQASSSVPPLSTPVIDLSPPKPKSNTLDNTTQNLGSRVFALELQDLPHKINQTVNEVVKEVVHVALQSPLRDRFKEMPKADMKEIIHQRMFKSGTYKSLPEHVALYEAPEVSMERANIDEFLAENDKSRKRRRDDQDPPPPPPDSDLSKKKRHESEASGSSQPPAPQSSVWKTSDTREAPSSSSKKQSGPYSEQPFEDIPMPDTAHISDSEDTDTAHLPKIKPRLDWLKHIPEEDIPKTPEPDWPRKTSYFGRLVIWDYSSHGFAKELGKRSLMEECHRMLTNQVDLVNPEGHRLVPDVRQTVTWETTGHGDKGRRSALSISKLKATQYLYFGLEELVPSLWIETECEYDISAAYGISHWWFKRKEFYITRHSAPSNRSTVRSYIRILSVVSLKTYEIYGYPFLKEIVLRRADYKEYKISKADFKNMHPNDFKDLYLLHLQGQLNHLSGADIVHLFNAVNLWIRNNVIRKRMEDLQLGIESYQTKLNLTQPDWDASDFLFKEDYTIVSKPRAVIYRDRNDQKKMMRETEVHKFSDGTLNRILDKLDHMVKDFKLYEYNPGMETRIWSENDRRRSKDFMEVIKRRLKIRRIFRSLKSFVGGRLRDVDYRLIQRTE
ncbi:hypothetical protein Tco_1373564 [Tanacetum coccineum]